MITFWPLVLILKIYDLGYHWLDFLKDSLCSRSLGFLKRSKDYWFVEFLSEILMDSWTSFFEVTEKMFVFVHSGALHHLLNLDFLGCLVKVLEVLLND